MDFDNSSATEANKIVLVYVFDDGDTIFQPLEDGTLTDPDTGEELKIDHVLILHDEMF